MKVGMISLGCDKNRVDSEKMLALLSGAGYTLTDDLSAADIVVINTCAFIDSAKKEAIDNILSVAEYKADSLQYLVVTGCFAERYGREVDFPEVDLFIDIKEEEHIVEHLNSLCHTDFTPCMDEGRILTTPAHYAYLKIADGCNNRCTYCAIPYIRGRYYSTPIEKLVEEAKELQKDGVKELILVAQDTTRYGEDLYGKPSLVALLKELSKLDFWKIRILYAYPELIDDELLGYMNGDEKIARYLDIPMQHVNPTVLKKMARRGSDNLPGLIEKIRLKVPDITIRSTFICGFPFETEKEHEELTAFLDGGVDFGGFFAYSPEEGTPSAKWKNRVNKKISARWVRECEIAQTKSTLRSQQRFVGRTMEVLYEGIDYEKNAFYGRTEHNCPDVDTKVYLYSDSPLSVGQVYSVRIDSADFHLYGTVLED